MCRGCLRTGCCQRPLHKRDCEVLASRDNLVLAAMDRGIGGRPAGLPPHQDRRPSPLDGGAAAPPWRGLTDGETADPAERLAERAVAVGYEQRHAEHALA